MSEEHFARLLHDRGIVLYGPKIKSVQFNAQFLLELKAEHGSAARFFANLPDTDFIGLLDAEEARQPPRGDTAGRFLRAMALSSLPPTCWQHWSAKVLSIAHRRAR
jgi:3-methyladenine DNA glycosylase Tag